MCAVHTIVHCNLSWDQFHVFRIHILLFSQVLFPTSTAMYKVLLKMQKDWLTQTFSSCCVLPSPCCQSFHAAFDFRFVYPVHNHHKHAQITQCGTTHKNMNMQINGVLQNIIHVLLLVAKTQQNTGESFYILGSSNFAITPHSCFLMVFLLYSLP